MIFDSQAAHMMIKELSGIAPLFNFRSGNTL